VKVTGQSGQWLFLCGDTDCITDQEPRMALVCLMLTSCHNCDMDAQGMLMVVPTIATLAIQ
jgi:hypothetical protein